MKLRIEAAPPGMDDRYVGDSLRVQQILANYVDNGKSLSPALTGVLA